MNEIRDEAVVLRTYKSGEADRVVVAYCREHGKIRAIAKGVRKPTTRIGGGLEPASHVRLFLLKGRGELHIVRQVEHLSRHEVTRANLERLTASLAIVEAVDAIPVDGAADDEIFTMLVRALSTLDDESFFPRLAPAAFFFKLIGHDGAEPVLHECASCGSLGPLVAFDAEVGGVLCANCRQGHSMSPDGLVLLRRLLGGDLAAVLRDAEPTGANEVADIARISMERHFGRRLKVPSS